MGRVTCAVFLVAMYLCGTPASAQLYFHGYRCTIDCSGHEAGYSWAQRNDITDPDACRGNSRSFIEGCLAYAGENASAWGDAEHSWYWFILLGAIIIGAYCLGRYQRKTRHAFVLAGTTTLSKENNSPKSRLSNGQWTLVCLVVRNTGPYHKGHRVKVEAIQDQTDGKHLHSGFGGYMRFLRTEHQRDDDLARGYSDYLRTGGRFALGYDEVTNVVLARARPTGTDPPIIEWLDGSGVALMRHRAVYAVTVALCGKTTTRYKVKLWVEGNRIYDKDPKDPLNKFPDLWSD